VNWLSDSPVESRTIEYIPASARHGRPNTLLTFWFTGNVQLTLVAIGAIAPIIGLDLKWSLLSLVVGNMVGGVFMAYHSAQGPKLGMPQMIQSRAQFGFLGAILPLVAAVLMYMAFYITSAVLLGEAFATLAHISSTAGIIITSVITLLITWIGYDIFHAIARPLSIISMALFVALTIKIVGHLPQHYHGAHVTAGTILLSLSIAATGQITWAPYVSDYSRYLPEGTPPMRTFWYTYIGSVLGAAWMESLGAVTAIASASAFDNAPSYMASQFPAIHALVLIVIIAGVLFANMENLYGSFLTAFAAVSPGGTARSGLMIRVIFTTVAATIGTIFAIAASAHLLTDLENFLLFLLYLLVPWTAINLTDFYLIRKGDYTIADFFEARGPFGLVNWIGVGVFCATVLVELPFMNTSLYVGHVSKAMGGADIAWLVGLAFAAVAYLVLKRTRIGSPTVAGPGVWPKYLVPAGQPDDV
jgi:NCS1 family nucleobase:cation symporter-1